MTFTNKTIHSKRLDKDFDALCWEMPKKGRVETVVAHEAFEDIIFNTEMPPGFCYEVAPIIGIASYPVMQCTMTDDTGRKIFAIGEAHPNTLINSISRNNPVIMAFNRAFDRAAIRYLDFEGKFYSSAEIPDDKDVGTSDEFDENDIIGSDNEEYIVDEELAPEPKTEPEESKPSPESFGTIVINMGKYKNLGKTAAQVWSEDESWAKYMANLPVSDTASGLAKIQYEALREYGKHLHKI